MKKFLIICLSLLLMCMPFCAFAENADEDKTEQIMSQSAPKLIVSAFSVSPEVVEPDKKSAMTITVKNTEKQTNIRNIKLTFACDDGSVLPIKTDSVWLEELKADSEWQWKLDITASSSAVTGKHSVTVAAEYETPSGEALTSSDRITVGVRVPEVTETKANTSQPRLMVTDFSLENGMLTPDSSGVLSVTIHNTNKNRSVQNIKLSCGDESGEIKTEGVGTAFVDKIHADGSYKWEIKLTAVNTATVGEHNFTISMEYEDSDGGAYSATDTIRIPIKQPVHLDYDGVTLPPKCTQDDTVSMTVNFMNSGKSQIYNCRFTCKIDGLVAPNSTFLGEIPIGESKSGSMNLRVDAEKYGETAGTVTITYEDDFGTEYTEEVPIKTILEEKKDIAAEKEGKEQEKKNTLWWLFLIIGLLAGGGAGFGIPFAINSKKQRKEDEQRL